MFFISLVTVVQVFASKSQMSYKGDIFYIEQVLCGKTEAYSLIIDSHKDRGFNLAFRISGNREDAEEILQDSFLKAFNSLKGFRMKSSFSTWFYRIVYNTAVSRVRSRKNSPLSLEEFPADYVDFFTKGQTQEDTEREYRESLINFALQKISEEERALITLHYYEDLDIREISDITGISSTNIKVRLFRARQKMIQIIAKAEKKNLILNG